MTLILNEIFDLILHYKCLNEDITPSIVLQKCPSKRLVPAYYEIISKPIDLIMIKTKLDNGEYLSFDLFEQDLALLFKNAIVREYIELKKNRLFRIFLFYCRHFVVKILMKHE